MTKNTSMIRFLFSTHWSLGAKVFRSFYRIGKARLFPKRDTGYNHFKKLALVYLKLTPVCNLRCVMCGQYGDKGIMKDCAPGEIQKTLPLEIWKRVADEIAPQGPITYVWGGEPFLYPDLLPLVRYMVQKGLLVSVNTNGTLVEQYAEEIVRDKWSGLLVSLDAFRDVNDDIRGRNSYDRVIAGIKAINREKQKQKSRYPFLSLVTVVTNKNYMDLDNLAEASKEYNLNLHVINLGTYTNDKIVADQRRFMQEKLDTNIDCLEGYNTGYNLGIDGQKLHDILQNLHRKDYGHPMLTVPVLNPEKTHTYYADLETPVRNHCVVPWCQANVNYNGDVHFCADYPDYILGNVTQQSFREIFNGERANRFRKAIHASEDGLFPGCLRCYQNMLFGKKIKGF
jgi:radical SAM protein with 4Fe4S-binding SPASM domain